MFVSNLLVYVHSYAFTIHEDQKAAMAKKEMLLLLQM